ncbi:uncharacterized protein HaLaN_15943, partial [Haematococcus lacustris]
QVEEHVQAWADAGHELHETQEEIQRLAKMAVAVEDKSESQVCFRLLVVDTSSAKAALADKALQLRSALLQWLDATWTADNQAVVNNFEEIVAHMQQTPENTEAMDALEKYLGVIEGQLDDFAAKISYSRKVYGVLYGAQHLLSEFADELYWRMCRWPLLLNSELEDVRSRLTRFRTRYMTQLKAEQVALAKDLAELRAEVDKFTTLGDLKQVDDRTSQVADLHSRLQRMGELAELYQARETIFGLPTTDYPQIELIQKTLDPYATLWQTCGEFMRCLPDWMDGPFTEIDADAMAADVDRWWRGTAKLAKSLEGPPLEVVAQFPVKVDAGFSVSRALQL